MKIYFFTFFILFSSLFGMESMSNKEKFLIILNRICSTLNKVRPELGTCPSILAVPLYLSRDNQGVVSHSDAVNSLLCSEKISLISLRERLERLVNTIASPIISLSELICLINNDVLYQEYVLIQKEKKDTSDSTVAIAFLCQFFHEASTTFVSKDCLYEILNSSEEK